MQFYIDVLGFIKKNEMPLGEFKWLTVVSPALPDGVELLLEPNSNPAASTYQKAIFEQGIPATAFNVDDIDKEYERLLSLGVHFVASPAQEGPVKSAVLDDTCGNLIQLYQL